MRSQKTARVELNYLTILIHHGRLRLAQPQLGHVTLFGTFIRNNFMMGEASLHPNGGSLPKG
jgi:hypothetical protein